MKKRPRRADTARQCYRLYTGLYPFGEAWAGLWIVRCSKCPFESSPEALSDAKRIARHHDSTHHQGADHDAR